MIRTIQFDTELDIKIPVPIKCRGLVGMSYKGGNTYRVRAMNIKTKEMLVDKEIQYTAIKGNSRKNYSKLRDVALNAVEGRPLNYARVDEK